MADLTYRTCNFLLKKMLRTLSEWQVEGEHNVPLDGPVIIASNHLSNIDPALLACSIPRRLNFVAKRGLFKPLASNFFYAYGAFPMNRDGRDIEAFLWARKLLNQNRAMVFFPEAQRNPVGGMKRAFSGVALLGLRTQAPIIPVGITGTEHIGPPWQIAFPTGKLKVRIGPAINLPAVEGPMDRPVLESFQDEVMAQIASLLPEPYQGVYSLNQPQTDKS